MAEIVVGTMLCILVDILALVLAPETADAGNAIVHWLVWFIFVFWFHFKGIKSETNFANILKRLGIQIIPLTYTLSFLWVVRKTNHPNIPLETLAQAPEFKLARRVDRWAAERQKKVAGGVGRLAKAV